MLWWREMDARGLGSVMGLPGAIGLQRHDGTEMRQSSHSSCDTVSHTLTTHQILERSSTKLLVEEPVDLHQSAMLPTRPGLETCIVKSLRVSYFGSPATSVQGIKAGGHVSKLGSQTHGLSLQRR